MPSPTALRSLNRNSQITASVADSPGDDLAAPILRYDYSQLAPAVRGEVEQAAITIKRQEQQVRAGIIAVGQRLSAVKSLLQHGQFSDWCETEFAMSQRTAQRMMQVAEVFKNDTVSFLSDTVLYQLAAPSTPEGARAQVIAEARAAGQSPTKVRVQEVIAQHRPPARVRYVPAGDALPPADDLPVRHQEPSVVPSSAAHSRQMGAALGKCAVCGRPLSDPVHAAAGCGPICSARRAGNFVAAQADSSEAQRTVVTVDGDTVHVELLTAWAASMHGRTHNRLAALRDLLADLVDAVPEYEAVTGDAAGAESLRGAVVGPLARLSVLLTAR